MRFQRAQIVERGDPARGLDPPVGKTLRRVLQQAKIGPRQHAVAAHIGQQQIDDLIPTAEACPVGKAGAWEWDVTDPSLAPLRALTLARFGLSLRNPTKARTGRVVTA